MDKMLYNWTKLKVFLLFNLKVQVHIYNYPSIKVKLLIPKY